MAQAPIVQSYDPRAWAQAWDEARTADRAEHQHAGGFRGLLKKPMIAAAVVVLLLSLVGLAYAFGGTDNIEAGQDMTVTTRAELTAALNEAPLQLSRSFRLGDIAELETTLTTSGFEATLVADLLIMAYSYFSSDDQLRPIGFGQEQLQDGVAPTDARNRRVEIVRGDADEAADDACRVTPAEPVLVSTD